MEHSSDLVYEGKHIGEHSYSQRSTKFREVELEGAKIDFFDPQTKTIHETKKSNAFEKAHVAQVKYYQYLLHKNGVPDTKGIIEYPKQRKRIEIEPLEVGGFVEIEKWVKAVKTIGDEETMPFRKDKPSKCKNCSYHDFCWISENEEL